MCSSLDFPPLPFDLGVEEERVPGLVKTVGNRPTGSSKEIEPPLGGTNPDTRKSKQTRQIKGQPETKIPTNKPKL